MGRIYPVLAVILLSVLAGVVARAQTTSLAQLTEVQQAAQTTAVKDYDQQNFAAALPIFTQLTALGDVVSETDLGRMYYYGWGVLQNQDQAFALISEAAAQHYGRAEDVLGRMYQYRGIYDKAFFWYTQSAQEGYAPGESDLGHVYHYGIGTTLDYGQAKHWDEAAAAQGDGAGYNGLGDIYYFGQGVPHDYARALTYFRLAAAYGEPEGYIGIGDIYLYGFGVPQNYAIAKQNFLSAVRVGCGCGETTIGYMYELGLGVPANEAIAFAWYTLAARDGDAQGESNLGQMYEVGRGTKVDIGKAVYWYKVAVAQGNADGERNLGNMYRSGQGVEQNDSEAAQLYQLAAAQGNNDAQAKLGLLYLDGRGVAQNTTAAEQLFKQAVGQNDPAGDEDVGWVLQNAGHYDLALQYLAAGAEAGDLEAQINLGYMYETGEAVPQSYQNELKWAFITRSMLEYAPSKFPFTYSEIYNLTNVHMQVAFGHLRGRQIDTARDEAAAWLTAHGAHLDNSLVPVRKSNLPFLVMVVIAILCLYGLTKSIQRRKRLIADRGAETPAENQT